MTTLVDSGLATVTANRQAPRGTTTVLNDTTPPEERWAGRIATVEAERCGARERLV